MATSSVPQYPVGPPVQVYLLQGTDPEVRRRQQLNLERHRAEQIQNSITIILSKKEKDEYGADILDFMFEAEVNTIPDVASMDIQSEVGWYMRPYLLDFLGEAGIAFNLTPDTLFLAISILDRYCSKRTVYRKHYQLVGCTALLIAAKYEEVGKQVPTIGELANMCCNLYEEDMFIQMERHVLMTLEWNVGAPTASAFIRSALDDGPEDKELANMALYICENAVFHREFLSLRASELAKTAITLAFILLGRQNYLGDHHWSVQQEQAVVISLSEYLTSRSDILFEKYKQPGCSYVALLVDSFFARQEAMAAFANNQRIRPDSPVSSPGHATIRITPRKRAYPFEDELPLTPPITPTAIFDIKDAEFPEVLVSTGSEEVTYINSFTMADAT